MKRTPGVQVPAPIFSRRRPRQALFAHPNSQEETSSESCTRYGQSSTHHSNHMLSHTLDEPEQMSVSPYNYQCASHMPVSTSQGAVVSGASTMRSRGRQSNGGTNPNQNTGYKFAPVSKGNMSVYSRTPRIQPSHTTTNQKQAFSSSTGNAQHQAKTYSGDCTDNELVKMTSASSSKYPRDKNWLENKDNRSNVQYGNLMKSIHENTPAKSPNDLKHESYTRGFNIDQNSLMQGNASMQKFTSKREKSAFADTVSTVTADNSLHFITATIQGMKHWSKFTQKIQMIFEVFGTLNSAISSTSDNDCVHFRIKDDRDSVQCIFYEIDRQLPRLIRAQWHRCVGSFNEKTKTFHCVSIRAAEQAEIRLYRNQVNICDKTLRILVSSIAET